MRSPLRLAVTRCVALAGMVLLGACSAESPEPKETPQGTPQETPQEGATLQERSDKVLSGRMEIEGSTVEFTSRQVGEQVFAVEVLRGGLTLTADLDFARGQVLFDGFQTDTGEDVHLTEADKHVIEALGSALSAQQVSVTYEDPTRRGVQIHTAGSALMRAAGLWKVTPPERSLRKDIKAVRGRSVLYLCGWLTGFGIQSTHDCWDCWDDWDGWSYVNPGPNGYSYNCYPDSCGRTNAQGEGDPVYNGACGNPYSCGRLSCEQSGGGYNGTWQWGSDGDKYGACTVWDTNIYPIDCLDHDHCVRNDHITASGYCNDMLDNASDDQTMGVDCKMMDGCGGRCGGSYTADGKTCFCDSLCDSYGDCCSDYHLYCDAGEGYKSYLGRSVARSWGYASRGGSYGR